MPRINIEQDERYDYGYVLDPKGQHNVPQETLDRWLAAKNTYEESLEKMGILIIGLRERATRKERKRLAKVAAQTEAVAREVFGSTDTVFASKPV